MGAIQDLAEQTAGGVINGALGMALGSLNDKRQLNQQQRLQDMQIRGQEQLTDYNYSKQLQMWHDTNYGAQVQELDKAGLNPGLLYGGGGGGGTTTGSAGGAVSGAQAPSGGHEAIDMIGMGLNMQLLKAQKEVLETQAQKNKAEADKTAGIDTTVATSQNESILQGVDNLRQDYELKKLDVTLKNITNYEQQASQGDRLRYIATQTQTAIQQLGILGNDKKISDATVQDNIKRIKAEAIGSVLDNVLKQSQNVKITADTQLTREQYKKIANDIMLNWDQLSNEQKKTEIQKQLMNWTTDPNREAIQQGVQTLNSIIHAIH